MFVVCERIRWNESIAIPVVLTALAITLAACADDPTAPVDRPAVVAVDVTPSALALGTGDTIRLRATPRAAGGIALTDRVVSWSSTDTSVATVSRAGLVDARGTGAAEIHAQVEGQRGIATLTVDDPVSPAPGLLRVSPTSAGAGSGALTLSVFGSGFAPGAAVLWDDAPRPTTRLTSTQLEAAIGAADLAIARTVRVTVRNPAPHDGVSGAVSFLVTPSVGPTPVAYVTVRPETAVLPARSAIQLHAAAYAADGTVLADRPFTWTSLSPATALVDDTGRVTAHRLGRVQIRVESEGKTAHAEIEVIADVDRMTVTPNAATLPEGGQVQLQATAYAADGTVLTDRPFTWTSSASATASVNSMGTVTAHHVGVALITVESEGRRAQARIDVVPPVAFVVVEPSSSAVLVGGHVQLRATTLASTGGVLEGRAISWSSEDPLTATVDADGWVFGVKKGTTRVFAESEGKVGWSTVEVRQLAGGDTQIYELRGLFDSGFLPSVGTTTWVDPQGIGHPATLFLRSGVLSIHTDQSRYEQEFVIDVFVEGRGVVGQEVWPDHGLLGYAFPDAGYVFTSSVTQVSFTGLGAGAGELRVQQAIGTLPVLAYRWVVR